MEFQTSRAEPGTYNVAVDGLTGTFTVAEAEEEAGFPIIIAVFIAIVVVLAGGAAAFLFLRRRRGVGA